MKQLFLCICILISTTIYSNNWELSVNNKSKEYAGIAIGNGQLGCVSTTELFSCKEIVMNGVYDYVYQGDVSRIVGAMDFMHLNLYCDNEEVTYQNCDNWSQTINMREAYLETHFVYKNKVDITYQMRALRHLPHMVLTSIQVKALKSCQIEFQNKIRFPNRLNKTKTLFKEMRDLEAYMPVLSSSAETYTGLFQLGSSTAFIVEKSEQEKIISNKESLHQTMSYIFDLVANERKVFDVIGAVCSTQDTPTPQLDAERMVVTVMRQSVNQNIQRHKLEWKKLWMSDILIEGDDVLQKDIRLALFQIYSSTRKKSRLSIAPMGLSTTTGYNGHIFWDAEMWIYPPLLVLHPDLAKNMLDYRIDLVQQAAKRANDYGYKGVMFPWESDMSGFEATPSWCLTGTFEQHVTADVGIAMWKYYQNTQDSIWLKTQGYPIISKVANFWMSRVSMNSNGSYSINNVVGADEFAANVDDNAYTNGAVKYLLSKAALASKVVGDTTYNQWQNVASKIYFPKFKDGTYCEYDGYKGDTIKQADVNLLTYPLGIVNDSLQIHKNLNYYESRVFHNGPAMSHSIFSIIYAHQNNPERAYELLMKSYVLHKREPFGALSESPKSSNPYFVTGAGGLLQSIMYGFAGISHTDNGLEIHPNILPKKWRRLTISCEGKVLVDIKN